MKQITLNLSDEAISALNQVAEGTGVQRAALIRLAIATLLSMPEYKRFIREGDGTND